MNMNDPPLAAGAPAPAPAPEVFRQLGLITRQLHDTLNQLGILPMLQQSAEGLSDARSRLGYIVKKTGEAAEKVLNSVDKAKAEHELIASATQRLTQAMRDDPSSASTRAAVMSLVGTVDASAARIDDHLTDIMMAQDFHDLTGQVVAKVVALAIDLEDSLVKLLVQAAPAELVSRPEVFVLAGPVVDATGCVDVVSNQSEVDDLLASLGF